jgi:hypothetical protein
MAGPIVPNVCTEAADEIERLRAGGCVRDQRTTQYCAEAVRLQAERDEARREVQTLERHASALTERQSDIVARLRSWAKGADEQGVQEIFDGLNFAADEIERLRELLQTSYEFTKTLTAERDEARRMVCSHEADLMEDMIEHAKHRGWDCFKEER